MRPTSTIVLFNCWKLEQSASAHSMVLLRGDPMGRETSTLSCWGLKDAPLSEEDLYRYSKWVLVRLEQ